MSVWCAERCLVSISVIDADLVITRLKINSTYRFHSVFHVSLIKSFKGNPNAPGHKPAGPITLLEDGAYWAVNRLLAHRERKYHNNKTRREYLVSWEGYGPEHNSWEPANNITEAAIDEYEASLAQWEQLQTRVANRTKRARTD